MTEEIKNRLSSGLESVIIALATLEHATENEPNIHQVRKSVSALTDLITIKLTNIRNDLNNCPESDCH